MSEVDLDCLTCGACCAPSIDSPTYVEVTARERARLPGRFLLQVVNGELATTKTETGVRCIALRGTVGEAVRCAIHPLRPSACKRFRAGSEACLEARAELL